MRSEPDILDRAAELRTEPDVLTRLRAAADTRVVVMREGRVRVADGAVLRVGVESVGEAEWALLGRDGDGAALLLASAPALTASLDSAPEETWLGLRDVGGMLDAHESELFVTAVALSAWLTDAVFCARCGDRLSLQGAGWSRRCAACEIEHFPRTDPAIIVAVESPDGERLLLGANATWRGRMHSCFAGFVEAGESVEDTVRRELLEEVGVRVRDIRYVSSQAWPYPRSLMLGFRAVARDEDVRPDGEEIIDARWLTRAELRTALAGDGPVGLPGPASIARRLIADWCDSHPAPLAEEPPASVVPSGSK
ncbi:NAD(+) diphosphatase [Microbacterium sp. ARD32]|uniref:NAD(+) diphosphatase n=1 Tax=Microbacterium sp. ARD32 TaxID=2962577 RepID=UPI002882B2DC|nr:NAD(+) diphosphatase [Microbacterium sp. ARD32]MDT0156721.1 NAD(+) diphosphatase [Microbacterium sp. ARD32]